MKRWRRLRPFLLLEWREARRHPGRSILVLLLVAVPVAAIVGGSLVARMTEPTPQEQATQLMGGAALRIEAVGDHEERQRARSLLPQHASHEMLFVGQENVRVPGRKLRAKVLAVDSSPASGLWDGMVRLTDGRMPANSAEVALSASLMDGLERSLGQTVTLPYGPIRTITGVVVDPEDLAMPLVIRTAAHVEHRGVHHLLVDVPAGEVHEVVAQLQEAGFTAQSRTTAGLGLGFVDDLVFVLGTLGFVEAALVIAAAFVVGLRRRQYEIGLAGSVGATVGGICVALLTTAAITALIGGVLGAMLGSGVVWLVHGQLDQWNGRANGDFEISLVHTIGAIVLGVLAAVIAALLPVINAARVPIRVALGGRRPPAGRSRGWLAVGLVMVALSLLLVLGAPRSNVVLTTLAVVVGPILGVLGFGVCSPWLLGWLASLARPLPLPWRLAVRDAGRFRGRNGPVVTAILAGMAMSVTVAVLVRGLDAFFATLPAMYQPDQILVEGPDAEAVAQELEAKLPCVASTPLAAVYSGGIPVRARFGEESRAFTREWVACGDEQLLRALHVEAAVTAFRSGKLIAIDPGDPEGPLQLSSWIRERAIETPLHVTVSTREPVMEPRFLLHQDAAIRLGLEPGPPLNRTMIPWMLRLKQPLTTEQLQTAQAIAAKGINTTVDAGMLHHRPTRLFYVIVLVVCLIAGLIVVAVAVSLSAAESISDKRVLETVGASPSLLRAHTAAQAAYLAFLGCLLAIPAGVIPAMSLFRTANFPLEFVMPWREVILTIIALPLAVYGCGWILASRMNWIRVGRGGWAAATLALLAIGTVTEGSEQRLEPHTGVAFDGSPIEGELGRIVVPENRDRPGGPTIELAYVRYRTTNPNPQPPVLFLAGGPGGSGVELCASIATHPQIRLLEHCDVIGLDQRGTGSSQPNLLQPFEVSIPLEQPLDRDTMLRELQGAAERCVEHWRDRGVDLAAYNTHESAADLEALRRALGLKTVVLYGASYGSHLALAYLRDHAEHVERAIILRVEGPDHTHKLPSTTQRYLEKLHQMVASDPDMAQRLPDLLGQVEQLIGQLRSEQQVVDVEGIGTVAIGPFDLEMWLCYALSDSRLMADAPAGLWSFSKGEWEPLAQTAIEHRSMSVNAMTLMMDCSSGASRDRLRRIRAEASDPNNVLSDTMLFPYHHDLCGVSDADLGDDFREPFGCDVPILFVSGELDARTPPDNVESLIASFPNAAHVRIVNAGHDSRELMSADYRNLMQGFLRGAAIESCTIHLPFVFQPIDG